MTDNQTDCLFELTRLEGEDEDSVPSGFKIRVVRRNVVDSDGLLIQPSAFKHLDGKPFELRRGHSKEDAPSYGGGHYQVTDEEVWGIGKFHPNTWGKDFAIELNELERLGVGIQGSVGGQYYEHNMRSGSQLYPRERRLNPKAVVDKVAAAPEISIGRSGKMAGSTVILTRLEESGTESSETRNRRAKLQEKIAKALAD